MTVELDESMGSMSFDVRALDNGRYLISAVAESSTLGPFGSSITLHECPQSDNDAGVRT